jgi:hypothetical protein
MGVAAQAQSIQISASYASVVIDDATVEPATLDGQVIVKNISANPIDVRVRRLVNDYPAGTGGTYFCWDVCYGPSVGLSGGAAGNGRTIAPSASLSDFTAHFRPMNIESCATNVFRFFNKLDTTDYVDITIYYKTTNATCTVDISAETAAQNALGMPYPNPASTSAALSYTLPQGETKGTVTLTNVMGQVVNRYDLTQNTGELAVDLQNVSNGLYYVTLANAQGQIITTRKISVAK